MSNFNHSIDKMVKDKFLAIYNSALERANKTFDQDYLPQIESLSIYDQIKFLKERKQEIKEEEKNVRVTAYLKNFIAEEWLLKLFSSRTSILNIDDSEELNSSVYLGFLRSRISDFLGALKDKVEPYSYDQFIKGKTDPLLFELEYTLHVGDREDFMKIRTWQSSKVLKVVEFETKRAIEKIQASLKQEANVNEIVEQDIKIYEDHISGQTYEKADELLEKLSQISFLSSFDFNNLDLPELIKDHKVFVSGDLPWLKITPDYSEHLKQRLKKFKDDLFFSDNPIIFYSIRQVIYWMREAFKTDTLQKPFSYPNYKSIVNETLEKAEIEAEQKIDEFLIDIKFDSLETKKAEKLFISKLEELRYDYNDSEEVMKEYFASLQQGANTEDMFSVNAFFFKLEDHIALLKDAYILREQIHFLIAHCCEFSSNNRVEYPNLEEGLGVSEISYLVHNMVLDNDLHEKLSKITDEFFLYSSAYLMPFDLALQNVREQMHDVFIESIDRLLNYLEDAEPGNKAMFIQSRLKQLKQRELSGQQMSKRYNDKISFNYTSLFREYLELEAEFIKETKDISFLPEFQSNKKIKSTNSKISNNKLDEPFSFGFKSKDHQKLKSFVLELNRQIYFLKDHVSAVDDFITVMTTDDLNQKLPNIAFNCETTQLYYIFVNLKPFFKNLTFKNIEKTQLFYTKSGNHLKGQNLSASKVDFPKNDQEIDNAFSLLQ